MKTIECEQNDEHSVVINRAVSIVASKQQKPALGSKGPKVKWPIT